jgi:LPXTG-motif cell wall-anchored protein
MKTLKKMLALVIAVVMTIGTMSFTALAAAPTEGSITVNSPVVGATYSAYKIFDMTTNEDVDAFSYTINEDSQFYGAVVAYAGDDNNGLTLSRIAGSNPAVYNVDVDESKFDAQAFGKAMQAVLAEGSPAVAEDADKGIVAKDAGTGPISKDAEKTATITEENTSDQLKFEELPLGYYLIDPAYPSAAAKTVTMGDKTFTDNDFVKNDDGTVKEPRELTADAEAKIDDYAEATVDDAYVAKYIADNGISTNKDGSPLNDAGKAEYKADLIASMKADAEQQILDAFNNNASEADINVKGEPILVFLDSSQPDAVINEKNEIDKWDIPVNPEGETLPGTPDHGEPKGGKNIIVQEDPVYYADWSEANTGESVHYQLRVNAMNFIRTGDTDATIEQVKEYFLADYQSAQMHFDESKGLKVTVWQGDNANNSQADTKANVTKDASGQTVTELDYTDKAGVFFKNTSNKDGKASDFDQGDNSVFGEGTGIMVPWVKVVEDPSEEELAELVAKFPVYTITNVPIEGEYETEEFKDGDPDTEGIQAINVKEVNAAGDWVDVPNQYVSVNNRVVNGSNQVLGDDGNPIQKTKPFYTFSLYDSDVTIVVDYWMILDDDAIVDEPGNKNFAQYGWSPVDNKDAQGKPKTPTNPSEEDKPSQKEKVDDATVYTFALAWVKVDEQGKELADAEFELPFYVKKAKDIDTYVYAFTTPPETYAEGDSPDNYTNKVTTTATSAVITIKGVEQDTYTITETQAPAGYNKLTAPFQVEAKKSGTSTTTKTKTVIYLDKDGNVTSEVTTATIEYDTDEDSFNNADAVSGEETSVPVYEFEPVVNKQGTELPSTGGIGTTIFYTLGAILVIGGGVLLVTRRRMATR